MEHEGKEVKNIEVTHDNAGKLSGSKKSVEYVFLYNSFFERYFNDPTEILDNSKGKGDRERRTYICLKIELDSNTFLIPLRKKLDKLPESIFKKACYAVPSSQKPNAGLDFRKIVVVNDVTLYRIDEAKISAQQRNTIQDNFDEIKRMAVDYINGFKKAAKKNRQKREPLYKFSALNNFLDELGIKSPVESTKK